MNKYYIILLSFVLFGCHLKNDTDSPCKNENIFISYKDFCNTAFDKDEPGLPLCYPFPFDSLKSMDQIYRLRTDLCKRNIIDCSGCISLSYLYDQDTIDVPAFSIICDNCCVSIERCPHILNIYLRNDSLFIKEQSICKNISLKQYQDKLDSLLSNTQSSFFKEWKGRKAYINNIDTLNVYRYCDGSYMTALYIEINDDSQIVNLKRYIDLAYDIYYKQLRYNLENIYQSNICKLSHNELKIFAKRLFFSISIYKTQNITII
jgi:hypothetical protein